MQQIQNELAKGQLENEKLKQEIAKIQAQTQQIMQGMAFDEREMRVREAEAVTNIKAGDFKRSVTPVTKPTLQMPGPYLEQGLKSNNLENI